MWAVVGHTPQDLVCEVLDVLVCEALAGFDNLVQVGWKTVSEYGFQ